MVLIETGFKTDPEALQACSCGCDLPGASASAGNMGDWQGACGCGCGETMRYIGVHWAART